MTLSTLSSQVAVQVVTTTVVAAVPVVIEAHTHPNHQAAVAQQKRH
jgi:hypothetical protein